ncbi:hypothetical protein V8F20_010243 [Naviculisporaceae sp. PSN 640]
MKLAVLVSTLFAALAYSSPIETAPKKCNCTTICLGLGQKCVSFPTEKGCKDVCLIPTFCGGIAGFSCEGKDEICVDDPRDDCDPKHGGADCGGLCVSKRLLG